MALADVPGLPSTFTATQTVFDLTSDATLLNSIEVTVRLSAADTVAADSEEVNQKDLGVETLCYL